MNCPSIDLDTYDNIPEEFETIVELARFKLSEVGKITIENNCTISFEVCRDVYEDVPLVIESKDKKIILKFIEKFAYTSYIVVYRIDKGL